MKLDPNCVRAVLLHIEENLNYTAGAGGVVAPKMTARQIQAAVPAYDLATTVYTLVKLKEAGFLNVTLVQSDSGTIYKCVVGGMTYNGHTFFGAYPR